MKKQILINAYTEFNLGDDLFIKVLCERYPSVRFALIAPRSYKEVFRAQPNLTVYASDSVLLRGINYVFRKLKLHPNFVRRFLGEHSGGSVQIGGSIFMQGEHWAEYVAAEEDLRSKSKPYFVMGANFGPYNDPAYLVHYRTIFRDYADICFRERYSYDLFQDLGNVRLAPDIIFGLQADGIPRSSTGEQYLALSVIRPSSKSVEGFDDLYYEKMKDIAVHFIEQGYAVRLVSFCRHEGDEEAVQQIRERVPEMLRSKVHSDLYRTDMEAILHMLAGASFVVASRFHAMILGWVLGKPVFPIAYSRKMIHVMEDAGYTGAYTDFSGLAGLTAEQVYSSMPGNRLDVSLQMLQAEQHFEQLDAYFAPSPVLEGRRSYES